MTLQVTTAEILQARAQVTRLDLPPKLTPVFQGEADVRGARGGRGSAKSRSFAKMAAIRAFELAIQGRKGVILCARQFMNSLADSSMQELKAAIDSEAWLAAQFDVGEKYIRTREGLAGRVEFLFAGLDRNIASVKSTARILLCWVDEAEPVTESAWQVLIPTLRDEGEGGSSELWITYNPEREGSATDLRFGPKAKPDPRAKIVEMNWRDNPFFPDILERTRQRDLIERPDSYDHIWEGDYVSVVQGAYYASALTAAKNEGRIGIVTADPLLTYRAFVVIGGTGARADAFAMWIAQFVGPQIRMLDYYEAVGQPLATHVAWMRGKGYTPDRAQVWLPHDGATHDKVFAVSYESALRQAGYQVTVVPNQGAGAAMQRVEALRRLFPSIWFNAETTEGGRKALGWYHEKRDDRRNMGLGPDHDWSSHGSDAAGLLAIAHQIPRQAQRIEPPKMSIV